MRALTAGLIRLLPVSSDGPRIGSAAHLFKSPPEARCTHPRSFQGRACAGARPIQPHDVPRGTFASGSRETPAFSLDAGLGERVGRRPRLDPASHRAAAIPSSLLCRCPGRAGHAADAWIRESPGLARLERLGRVAQRNGRYPSAEPRSDGPVLREAPEAARSRELAVWNSVLTSRAKPAGLRAAKNPPRPTAASALPRTGYRECPAHGSGNCCWSP